MREIPIDDFWHPLINGDLDDQEKMRRMMMVQATYEPFPTYEIARRVFASTVHETALRAAELHECRHRLDVHVALHTELIIFEEHFPNNPEWLLWPRDVPEGALERYDRALEEFFMLYRNQGKCHVNTVSTLFTCFCEEALGE